MLPGVVHATHWVWSRCVGLRVPGLNQASIFGTFVRRHLRQLLNGESIRISGLDGG